MGSEGVTGHRGAMESNGQRPGSRPSRLAGAGKQLAIVLEGVNLENEPALGEAVTDAVSAVDRAANLARGGADADRAADARGDDGTRGEGEASFDVGAAQPGTGLERRVHDRTLEQLVREAHAE